MIQLLDAIHLEAWFQMSQADLGIHFTTRHQFIEVCLRHKPLAQARLRPYGGPQMSARGLGRYSLGWERV